MVCGFAADKKSRSFSPRPTGLLYQAGRLRRQVLLPDGEDPALPGLPQDQALNLKKKVEKTIWEIEILVHASPTRFVRHIVTN